MILDKRTELIKKTAAQTNLEEDVVQKIISFHWKTALEAARGNDASIDVLGFGRFVIKKHRLEKKVEQFERIVKYLENKLSDESLTDRQKETIVKNIARKQEDIERLKAKELKKINENS